MRPVFPFKSSLTANNLPLLPDTTFTPGIFKNSSGLIELEHPTTQILVALKCSDKDLTLVKHFFSAVFVTAQVLTIMYSGSLLSLNPFFNKYSSIP